MNRTGSGSCPDCLEPRRHRSRTANPGSRCSSGKNRTRSGSCPDYLEPRRHRSRTANPDSRCSSGKNRSHLGNCPTSRECRHRPCRDTHWRSCCHFRRDSCPRRSPRRRRRSPTSSPTRSTRSTKGLPGKRVPWTRRRTARRLQPASTPDRSCAHEASADRAGRKGCGQDHSERVHRIASCSFLKSPRTRRNGKAPWRHSNAERDRCKTTRAKISREVASARLHPSLPSSVVPYARNPRKPDCKPKKALHPVLQEGQIHHAHDRDRGQH